MLLADSLGSAFDSTDSVVRVERKSDQLLGSFIYSNGDRLIVSTGGKSYSYN